MQQSLWLAVQGSNCSGVGQMAALLAVSVMFVVHLQRRAARVEDGR